jgi:hypothetical protein
VLSLRSLRFHCPPAAASPTHGAGVLAFAQRLSASSLLGFWCRVISA